MILGAGYLGAALADLALARGQAVLLADNWYATDRAQLHALERRGAHVETVDIRSRKQLDRILAGSFSRVYLLAAQASRPISERDPDYTEETNVSGVRRVAESVAAAGGPPVVFASSLHVYGPSPQGEVDVDHPYGPQADLAHLSKIYGELCLQLYARKRGFDLVILRLGILYGPGPVSHDRSESQTVVDKFKRLAADGAPLPLDDEGRATIGVAHVADAARILLDAPTETLTANVAAESVTVGGLAALLGGRKSGHDPACTYTTPFAYEHLLADYLR